ncbi:MAG: hypothetical protein HQL40_03975 [Alphaproteobacteria bacterium]|nr:hypothetical protein [Alphaproteobacteria bacterium]
MGRPCRARRIAFRRMASALHRSRNAEESLGPLRPAHRRRGVRRLVPPVTCGPGGARAALAGSSRHVRARSRPMTAMAIARYRCVARVTIQFETPFCVRSGDGDAFSDSAFVTDANGLPAIPGSSLAGILRNAAERLGIDLAIFGRRPEAAKKDLGEGSRLTVTWAHIHDHLDRPVDGLLAPDDPRLSHPVLRSARQGVVRDHVRIGHRGSAERTGKFDERVVPMGHRFTFDLGLQGGEPEKEVWPRLLNLLAWPGLRIGAGSRRGFGKFRLVRDAVRQRVFDLCESEDFAAYSRLPASLSEPADGLEDVKPVLDGPAELAVIRLQGLIADGGWLFGGGGALDNADIAPVREHVIEWAGEAALSERARLYLPASAIKGAFAHRLAWHHNRLRPQIRAEALPLAEIARHSGAGNQAVRTLLGHVADDDDDNPRAGRLLFADTYLAFGTEYGDERWHVSLDRFTQGARAGRLFCEHVMAPRGLGADYEIVLLTAGVDQIEAVDADMKRALWMTLRDMKDGRLTFGAAGNRGHGDIRCETIALCESARQWFGEVCHD